MDVVDIALYPEPRGVVMEAERKKTR